MTLRRDDWLNVARKVDWTYRYVSEDGGVPAEMSGRPWLPHEAWQGWNEAYRTTYREYVTNQRAKDDAVVGVRSALSKGHILEGLDPGWLQLVKFHNGALALAEYAGAVAELRMARFGRDSAWRMMATLGALDEIRHTQIPLLLGHDMLRFDGNFDWTHKAYHTNEWMIIAARHLFDDMFLAADAIDLAIQLNLVFETGFSNLQFMAMAAMADRASITSSRRPWPASRPTRPATPRSGTRFSEPSSRAAAPSGPSSWSTKCGGGAGDCSSPSPARPWNTWCQSRPGPGPSRNSWRNG